MTTIKLIVRKTRETQLGFPVVLYININGKRLQFYTDVYVKDESFLIDGKISRKDILWYKKNIRLLKILSDVSIIALEETDTNIIKEKVSEILGHQIKAQKRLIDYIEDFMRLKGKSRTAKLYESTIHKIKEYDANIKIEEVDKKWLLGFEEYCSKNMRINGYSVYLRNIRAVFNYLLQEGKITNYPFKAFKIKKEETLHRALSIDELRRLRDYECKDYCKKYRDIFMLMIYLVGINPKDLLYLKKDNIVDGRIVYHRFKTNKLYGIKLEPEAKELIDRYHGNNYLLSFIERNKDYLAFVRHMNKGLKTLGIKKDLTSYWARHTWASIAFEIGISKDVISLALGHSNGVKVTDIYIKYDWEKVDEANRKVIDYIKR